MPLRNFAVISLACVLLTGWGHWGPPVKIGLALDQSRGREVLSREIKEDLEGNRAELILRDAEGSSTTQERQVGDLLAQGIQALVILPVDPKKSGSLVEAAHKTGIKVISLERLIPTGGLDYLIAFDDIKTGELQAKAMVEKHPKGTFALFTGNDGSRIREGQFKGLSPYTEKGEIQVVSSLSAKNPLTPAQAAKEAEALLKPEKFHVDAVLASNNLRAQGTVLALEKEGLAGKVPVAGVGEDMESCRRIHAGTQTLTIYDSPKKLGEETAYLSAKIARKATQFDCQFTDVETKDGKTLAVYLSPKVVDGKNLESTIIKDGVQKKEDVYGK
ncbi:MAG TPA: substrate-binding domain-containing protein [bacterium]|nr:substrate-binding domain-containing protein [bacterium]